MALLAQTYRCKVLVWINGSSNERERGKLEKGIIDVQCVVITKKINCISYYLHTIIHYYCILNAKNST